MIEVNRNAAGRVSNIIFGMCQLIDGGIRIVSFVFLHTGLTLTWAKHSARIAMKSWKKEQGS